MDKPQEVLIEEIKEIGGQHYYIGHTKEYVKAAIPINKAADNKNNKENTLVTGIITGFLTDEILMMSSY
jgi:threonylcarbamoyladenosine tRNA methylthiotransferase MtaB